MSELKKRIGIDVLTAARQRIAWTFDTFPRIYVSFSGGKDSTVLTHLVADEAKKRGRKFGLMFVDLEAQYKLTIDFISSVFREYSQLVNPYWVSLPISLRNAVSVFDPRWKCWDTDEKEKWVRQPSEKSLVDPSLFPFFRDGMEFEEFVPGFGHWYGQDKLTACLVGIRSDESLNRFRTLMMGKTRFEGRCWTTWLGKSLWNVYPIYDWRTDDLWAYTAKEKKSYNRLYDRMHQAGLTIHQMRICQPYGDDQRKGLWLYHIIEPETWGKVVARVNGANSGALFSREAGNSQGRFKVTKPDGHTWESYAKFLLESLPPRSKTHFEDKIAVFLYWWRTRGYTDGIPDEADAKEEAAKKLPSWRRIVKALLKNDYWCKTLSFTMTTSGTSAYEKYRKIMDKRRRQWGF